MQITPLMGFVPLIPEPTYIHQDYSELTLVPTRGWQYRKVVLTLLLWCLPDVLSLLVAFLVPISTCVEEDTQIKLSRYLFLSALVNVGLTVVLLLFFATRDWCSGCRSGIYLTMTLQCLWILAVSFTGLLVVLQSHRNCIAQSEPQAICSLVLAVTRLLYLLLYCMIWCSYPGE